MLFKQRLLLKILIIYYFFRHNFVVFAGGDAVTNMIMTRIRIRNPKKNSDPDPE